MKTGNYLGAGMLGIAAVFVVTGSSVFSQSETPSPQSSASTAGQSQSEVDADRVRGQALVEAKLAAIESRDGPTQTERERHERKVRAGLEVYADNLERSWIELNESKSSLETRVQELERQLERLQ